MRWTVQQVNDGPAGTRSRGDSKPTRVKTKELASVWHHDIKTEISRAHPLLRDQGETLYILIMCFATNCLSSVTLDVGTRTQHGHQPGAFVFLRRPYNLKITVSATNVVSSAVATILVALGTETGLPYLYVPWLANTVRGMAFSEGPALLGIAYTLLPNADLSSTSFLFIALLLYVEELWLWNNVFSNFRDCWANYNAARSIHGKIGNVEPESTKNHEKAENELIGRKADQDTIEFVKDSRIPDGDTLQPCKTELLEASLPPYPQDDAEFFKAQPTSAKHLQRHNTRTRYTSSNTG